MRPTPVAAGFHACRPGKVSRAAKLDSSAIARRDTLRAMPLAVTDVTNSRREILIVPRLSPPDIEESTVATVAVRAQRRSSEGREHYYTGIGPQGRSASAHQGNW